MTPAAGFQIDQDKFNQLLRQCVNRLRVVPGNNQFLVVTKVLDDADLSLVDRSYYGRLLFKGLRHRPMSREFRRMA